MSGLQQVNLLRAELLPDRQPLTVIQLGIGCALFSVILVCTSAWDGLKLMSVNRDLAAGQNETAHLTVEIDTLRAAQAGSEKLLRAELVRLQQKRAEKSMLAQLLSNGTAKSQQAQQGITSALVALAEGSISGLWLEEIGIYPQRIRLLGRAQDPVLVPHYLQSIASGRRFQGHRFEMVELIQAEQQGQVMFSLTSPRAATDG